MKVVILAGGFGTRISEETINKPKPLVEIGGKPILWHIMKIYSYYGFNEFIICLGYKGDLIKKYFQDYFLLSSDIEIDLKKGKIKYLDSKSEEWKVSLVDTGKDSMTGGRLLRLKSLIKDRFMLTYGDGVGDINIKRLLEFHKKSKKIATVTAVQPPGRFGSLLINKEEVESFQEKPIGDGNWINGGFFVFEPEIFNFLKNDNTILESDSLSRLAELNELTAYKHESFWRPMDTLRDKTLLEQQWQKGEAKWKIWD